MNRSITEDRVAEIRDEISSLPSSTVTLPAKPAIDNKQIDDANIRAGRFLRLLRFECRHSGRSEDRVGKREEAP